MQRREGEGVVDRLVAVAFAVVQDFARSQIEVRFPGVGPGLLRPVGMMDVGEGRMDVGEASRAGEVDGPHHHERLRARPFVHGGNAGDLLQLRSAAGLTEQDPEQHVLHGEVRLATECRLHGRS